MPKFTFVTTSCFAQQIIPIYTSKSLKNNTLNIVSDSGYLSITAYNANIIKFCLSKEKNLADTANKNKPLNIRVTQNLENVYFTTDSLIILVNKYDLSIRILNKQEKLLTENKSFFMNNPKQQLLFNLDKNEAVVSVSKRGKTRKKLKDKFLFKSSKGYFLSFLEFDDDTSKVEIINETFSFEHNKRPISYLFFTKDFIR